MKDTILGAPGLVGSKSLEQLPTIDHERSLRMALLFEEICIPSGIDATSLVGTTAGLESDCSGPGGLCEPAQVLCPTAAAFDLRVRQTIEKSLIRRKVGELV